MDRRDWVLLALLAAEDHRLQPVQLQKSLFLLGKKLGDVGGEFYTFRSYHYGPFSREIYDDADALCSEGLVLIDCEGSFRWREYSATSDGLKRARSISESVKPPVWAYLQRAIAWTKRLSFGDLVRSIYAHFPEYREHSVFQD